MYRFIDIILDIVGTKDLQNLVHKDLGKNLYLMSCTTIWDQFGSKLINLFMQTHNRILLFPKQVLQTNRIYSN